MDSSKRKTESDSCEPNKKRTQCYQEAYTAKYAFIKPCSEASRVVCEICQTEFSIKYGGIYDIKRHVEGARHKKNSKTKELVKKSQQITGFFARAPTNSISSLELDTTRAEVTMVDLCVELNLPMSSLDKFSKAFKRIFPDSKIAKNFQCARSKGTAIVKEMAALTTMDLASRMKTGCFTLSTDGSNDKWGEKLFPLIVRTIDPKSMEVRSDALSVPAIEGSATGVKIFSLIEAEFNAHNIPWENCIAFRSDNANVMVGKDAGVYGCMLKKHPELHLAGCVCHLIHIAAEKVTSARTHVELPYYSKFLLIAAYLASYNPIKYDRRFFTKNSGKISKRAKILKKSERTSSHLLGPKLFPLDRLMAIFYSIVEGKVTPSALITVQISSLVSLHLLSQSGGEDKISAPKYKCMVDLDFIQAIARTVQFDIMRYLYDFL